MIRKKDCCGCGDWKSMLKELWEKYQDVVKGVKAGGVTAYPDGDGIADVTDAVASAVEQQISIALDDYVTDDELSAAIQYFVTQADVDSSISTALTGYQQTLVSGTNIKTVNGNSLLGSGNLVIQGGGSAAWGQITGTLDNQTDLKNALDAKQDAPSAAGTAGQVLGLDSSLNPVWVNQSGGGSANWGNIGGTLADQTDLKNALDAAAGSAAWGGITGTLDNQTDLKNALDAKFTSANFGSLGLMAWSSFLTTAPGFQLVRGNYSGGSWVQSGAVWFSKPFTAGPGIKITDPSQFSTSTICTIEVIGLPQTTYSV